jgi:hypothetical protein
MVILVRFASKFFSALKSVSRIRVLVLPVFAAGLAVAVAPLAARADSIENGRITAYWEGIYTPSTPNAVRSNGEWHAAGETYLRVDEQADVAVYSLSLSEPLDRTMPLKAITASTSAIPHLEQVTSLVRNSAEDSKRGTLTDARAAAYQIAIWHLADDLPIDRYHVRNAALRSVALELLRTSAALTDQINKCTGNQCPAALSTAATTAALSLQVGNTVGDSTLSISIVTPIQNVFNQRQYVNLRVNGLGATVCPGETDRIRVDLPVTHNVRKSSCNFLSNDPTPPHCTAHLHSPG